MSYVSNWPVATAQPPSLYGGGVVLPGRLSAYRKFQKLGEGSYGKVYLAQHESNPNTFVALKKISYASESSTFGNGDEGIPPSALREVALLRQLSTNEHIVTLLDVMCENSKLYLVFEYLNHDMRQYSDSLPPNALFGLDLVRSYLAQLLNGVHACHRHRVLHRDLKPQNLLLDQAGNLKIADFGLGRPFATTAPVAAVDYKTAAPEQGKFVVRHPLPGLPSGMYTEEVVTRWYRAPELLLGNTNYGTAIDVWSIGAIFAEMLTRWPMLPGDSNIDQQHQTFQLLGTPNEDIWPGVSKLPHWSSDLPKHAAPKDLRYAIFKNARDRSSHTMTYAFSATEPNAEFVDETLDTDGSGLFNLNVRLSDTGLDLLRGLLCYNPEHRITIKDALLHPYLSP